jgi:hypothetical protein
LLLYDLWLVRPFWRRLEGAINSRSVVESNSLFLWEPKKEEAWARLSPTKWRWRVALEESDRDKEDREKDGRHLFTTPVLWDTNRVSKAIQQVSVASLGVKIHIPCWRHSSKAIYRRYINDKAIIKVVMEGDKDSLGEDDDAFDIQTGHCSRTGGGVYGRLIHESPFHTTAERLMFRKVSQAWHRFLMFASVLQERPKKGTRAAEDQREAVEEELRRWRRMRVVDVQEQLETLVGEGAQFRGIQKGAIQAIMRQKSPIIAVMGTGAGKSLLFMLPAACRRPALFLPFHCPAC